MAGSSLRQLIQSFLVSTRMKLSVALAVLCVAVMAVMIYQTLRQELNLRNLKTRTMQNSAEVKRKEEAIVQVKNALNEMKAKLASVNTKIGELKKTRVATEKSTQELDTSLQTCNTEKASNTHLQFPHKSCFLLYAHTAAQATSITLCTKEYHSSGSTCTSVICSIQIFNLCF